MMWEEFVQEGKMDWGEQRETNAECTWENDSVVEADEGGQNMSVKKIVLNIICGFVKAATRMFFVFIFLLLFVWF